MKTSVNFNQKNNNIPAAGAAPAPAVPPPAAAGAATAPPAGTEANLERPMRGRKKSRLVFGQIV